MIPVYKPFIPESSVKYAKDAIESTWISSNGKYVDMAIEKLSEIGGYKYVFLIDLVTFVCFTNKQEDQEWRKNMIFLILHTLRLRHYS